jgi:hypothetical protein
VRRNLLYTATGLLAVVLVAGSAGAAGGKKPQLPKVADGETCNGDFGTSVKFLPTPVEAAKQALKDHKLVMVLHVSGDFEDPDFT